LFRVPELSSISHSTGVKVSLTETQMFNSKYCCPANGGTGNVSANENGEL
jgi:hypothetical protein